MLHVITKYNRPTAYDHQPFGTIWAAELEDSAESWIQTSREENVSVWQKLGDFLEDNMSQEEIEKILKRCT